MTTKKLLFSFHMNFFITSIDCKFRNGRIIWHMQCLYWHTHSIMFENFSHFSTISYPLLQRIELSMGRNDVFADQFHDDPSKVRKYLYE